MASAYKIHERGDGSFACWDPLNRKSVYLGKDRAEAIRQQAEILDRAGRGTSGVVSSGSQLPGETLKVATNTPAPMQNGSPVSASSLLDAWLASPSAQPIIPGDTAAPQGGTGAPTMPPPGPSPVAITKRKGSITPEQAAKIGGGLKRIVTKANVVLDGALVSMFGRKPAMPEDDELEMLALGWEMMIEEFFVKNTPKPWMLVAAGNVLMVSAMYLQGQPIPRKTKAERDAERAAQMTAVAGTQ